MIDVVIQMGYKFNKRNAGERLILVDDRHTGNFQGGHIMAENRTRHKSHRSLLHSAAKLLEVHPGWGGDDTIVCPICSRSFTMNRSWLYRRHTEKEHGVNPVSWLPPALHDKADKLKMLMWSIEQIIDRRMDPIPFEVEAAFLDVEQLLLAMIKEICLSRSMPRRRKAAA